VLPSGASQELSVRFTPADTNYAAVSAMVTINVIKGTPPITWVNPADIVYPTALGSGQLNAVSSVPGSFDYTPPAGTVLRSGAGQVLQVSFTPADTNYANASATVSITVLEGVLAVKFLEPRFLSNGLFTSKIEGVSNIGLQIEVSTNLSSWIRLLATNTTMGTLEWADPDSKSRSKGFYRVVVPQ
jgi:hypothetical protein